MLMSQIGIPPNPKPMDDLNVRFFTETFTGECNFSSVNRNDVIRVIGPEFFPTDDCIEEPSPASLGLVQLPPRPEASSSSGAVPSSLGVSSSTAQDSAPMPSSRKRSKTPPVVGNIPKPSTRESTSASIHGVDTSPGNAYTDLTPEPNEVDFKHISDSDLD